MKTFETRKIANLTKWLEHNNSQTDTSIIKQNLKDFSK